MNTLTYEDVTFNSFCCCTAATRRRNKGRDGKTKQNSKLSNLSSEMFLPEAAHVSDHRRVDYTPVCVCVRDTRLTFIYSSLHDLFYRNRHLVLVNTLTVQVLEI